MSEIRQEVPENVPVVKIPENDMEADNCIKAIRAAQDTKLFWKSYYLEQYQKVEEACDYDIANATNALRAYFDTVPHKETATQDNYRLPSGKLVLKVQEPEYKRDDKQIIDFLKRHGGRFVKTKEEVDWSNLKKNLLVVGETAADENGEIIPGIKVVARPLAFTIEK